MLKERQDAYGRMLKAYCDTGESIEIVEREDGFIDASGMGPRAYFSAYPDWEEHVKRGVDLAKGRILDIGCGAGRHSLYLQEKGHNAVGIDLSPLAIEVCKTRGLKNAVVLDIKDLGTSLGMFDTVLMMGNNFGLFGNPKLAKSKLKTLFIMTGTDGQIIAQIQDPYGTTNKEHLDYHAFNRRRGRMSGQLRIRVRYRSYATPWFDYLFVSKNELIKVLSGTGWKLAKTIDGQGSNYIAVIAKDLEGKED